MGPDEPLTFVWRSRLPRDKHTQEPPDARIEGESAASRACSGVKLADTHETNPGALGPIEEHTGDLPFTLRV